MKKYKFGIVLTTFDRFEYAQQMFMTLKTSSFLPNTILYISDDCSIDSNLINMIDDFSVDDNNLKIIKNFNKTNLGSKQNYQKSILFFEDKDVDFIINLDSDCLLNSKWLIKINELINDFDENIICSSFCCKYHHGNPYNYLKTIKENYYERDTLNGLGVCFPKSLLNDFKIETHKHFDEYLCKELKNKYNMTCICTKDSYIQHIGIYGVHSSPNTCDISNNFIGV